MGVVWGMGCLLLEFMVYVTGCLRLVPLGSWVSGSYRIESVGHRVSQCFTIYVCTHIYIYVYIYMYTMCIIYIHTYLGFGVGH